MEKTAVEFREHDEKRQPLLREIEVERAKLEQKGQTWSEKVEVVSGQLALVDELESRLSATQSALSDAEQKNSRTG